MRKLFTIFTLLTVFTVFANAQETDVTTLPWVQKGQGCTQDFNNPNGGTVFGTDANANISYVDVSAYGKITLYGPAGQTARLFVNRGEIGDKGIIYVDINESGVGEYDFSNMLTLQPNIQYIHLNGVKASAYNTTLNLSSITVSGDPIDFPEDVWTCPEGETDVTKLAWVNKAQGCANNLGANTDAPVFGTDAGGDAISYVDLSAYGSLKVYGPAGQTVRFFINRVEFPSNFQFRVTIDEKGVGVLDLANVLATQTGAEYVHLNGVKASNPGEKIKVDGITVVEAEWTLPEGETNYVSLEGFKDVNNIGNTLNSGDVVFGDQSNGDNYTDVTEYETVKFYGTPGAMLRVFVNREGGVSVGTTEQRIKIAENGVGTLNVKDVMSATGKDYCRISGIKICAKWQDANADVENGIVIKAITVVKSGSTPDPTPDPTDVTIEVNEALTFSSQKILDFSGVTDVEAYIAVGVNGNKVTMKKVTGAVPDNTGLVIVGNGTVTVPTATTATEDVSGNLLVAVGANTRTEPGVYVLAGSGETLGWYRTTESNHPYIYGGKCYLEVPETYAKQLTIVWGDDATNTDDVAAEAVVEDNAWYTTGGIKVAAPAEGLYIHNGKKVSVNK